MDGKSLELSGILTSKKVALRLKRKVRHVFEVHLYMEMKHEQ